MKIFVLIFISVFFFNLQSLDSYNEKKQEMTLEQKKILLKGLREGLKDYVFCRCLTMSYRRDSIITNDYSGGLKFHKSNYGMDVFRQIDSILEKLTDFEELHINVEEKTFNIYATNCLHLYNSKVLDSIVKEFDVYLTEEDLESFLEYKESLDFMRNRVDSLYLLKLKE